jgi:CarD family transcriptional regulator
VAFQVGSRVVHPCYGAGEIVRIREKSIGEISHTYYVIEAVVGDMELMVPVKRADEVGLREVEPMSTLDRVLELCTVQPDPEEMESDYRRRKAELGEALKSGDYAEVADVARRLYFRGTTRVLGATDRAMLNRAKDLLASELAMSAGADAEWAMERVESCLAAMIVEEAEVAS